MHMDEAGVEDQEMPEETREEEEEEEEEEKGP
jgi:hypothetical protein